MSAATTKSGPTPFSIDVGATCYWADDYSYDVICGGIRCFANFSLRLREAARGAARPATGPTPNYVIATWDCANGGGLSMNEYGSVTYHLPSSGGGGEPSGGGGALPCQPGTPADTNPDGSPRYDELRAALACDPIPVDSAAPGYAPDCDPLLPNCYDTLATASRASLQVGLSRIRPREEFADPEVATMCHDMLAAANTFLAQGRVWQGSPHVTDGPRPHRGASVEGPSNVWRIHIDADQFAIANDPNNINSDIYKSILAEILLHEVAHTKRLTHPDGPGANDVYPFNHISGGLLESGGPAQRCIK